MISAGGHWKCGCSESSQEPQRDSATPAAIFHKKMAWRQDKDWEDEQLRVTSEQHRSGIKQDSEWRVMTTKLKLEWVSTTVRLWGSIIFTPQTTSFVEWRRKCDVEVEELRWWGISEEPFRYSIQKSNRLNSFRRSPHTQRCTKHFMICCRLPINHRCGFLEMNQLGKNCPCTATGGDCSKP